MIFIPYLPYVGNVKEDRKLWSNVIEKDLMGVAEVPVANLLVNLVAGGVGEVGVEDAELLAGIEHFLRKRGDRGGGVALPPQLHRRVDEIDRDAVWSGARPGGHRDRAGGGVPEVNASLADGAPR